MRAGLTKYGALMEWHSLIGCSSRTSTIHQYVHFLRDWILTFFLSIAQLCCMQHNALAISHTAFSASTRAGSMQLCVKGLFSSAYKWQDRRTLPVLTIIGRLLCSCPPFLKLTNSLLKYSTAISHSQEEWGLPGLSSTIIPEQLRLNRSKDGIPLLSESFSLTRSGA